MKSAPLIKLLEENIDAIFEPERYRQFLEKAGRFHNYSFYNQLLILMQKPNAMRVAGYRAWQKMGRYVKRGEKGIYILAPRIIKVYKDKNGRELKRDELSPAELKKAIELGEVFVSERRSGYIGVTVFDISQTDGKPIHIMVEGLKGTYKDLDRLIRAVEKATKAKVIITDKIGMLNTMGYYDHLDNKIVVRKLDDVQVAKTLIHEAGHSILKKLTKNLELLDTVADKNSEEMLNLSREDEEVVVESAAYIVMSQLGIDTSEYSFNYIHGWATMKRTREDGKKALQSMFSIIAKVADVILSAIEEEFGIVKEKSEEHNEETIREEQASELLTVMEANRVNALIKSAI